MYESFWPSDPADEFLRERGDVVVVVVSFIGMDWAVVAAEFRLGDSLLRIIKNSEYRTRCISQAENNYF